LFHRALVSGDPATGRFRSYKGDPAGASPQDVRAMVEDSNGVLWLVSGTLQRFDPTTGRFTAYTFDPLGTGTAGREDSPGLIKVGKRIAEDSFLAIDHSGVLWMATGNGLLRFDREREQFTTYDERDGLPASSVNGILEDHNGNLWVSTAGGLSRFNPRTKTFTNNYEADGLAVRRPGAPEFRDHVIAAPLPGNRRPYEAIIRRQQRPPVLIGHSFGGRIVQRN
jgi:ligand-binding sensor domain-containing protein